MARAGGQEPRSWMRSEDNGGREDGVDGASLNGAQALSCAVVAFLLPRTLPACTEQGVIAQHLVAAVRIKRWFAWLSRWD